MRKNPQTRDTGNFIGCKRECPTYAAEVRTRQRNRRTKHSTSHISCLETSKRRFTKVINAEQDPSRKPLKKKGAFCYTGWTMNVKRDGRSLSIYSQRIVQGCFRGRREQQRRHQTHSTSTDTENQSITHSKKTLTKQPCTTISDTKDHFARICRCDPYFTGLSSCFLFFRQTSHLPQGSESVSPKYDNKS